jgi:hypothetical protein
MLSGQWPAAAVMIDQSPGLNEWFRAPEDLNLCLFFIERAPQSNTAPMQRGARTRNWRRSPDR